MQKWIFKMQIKQNYYNNSNNNHYLKELYLKIIYLDQNI